MIHPRSYSLLIYLRLELWLKEAHSVGLQLNTVAHDMTYLCLEYKVYLGGGGGSQHESSPLSSGTLQVVRIMQSASPEPLVSEITNLSQRLKGHVLYPLQDNQDPISKGAAGFQGPASPTQGSGHWQYWRGNGMGVGGPRVVFSDISRRRL